MEPIKYTDFKDKILLTGLILICISTVIFLLPEIETIHLNRESFAGIFFFNYIIFGIYIVVLLIDSFKKFKGSFYKNKIEYTILLLILLLISAFALNREFPIFARLTEWVRIYLVIQCLGLILLTVRRNLPSFFLTILYFILGCGMALYIYFAVYLVPLYIVGLVASFFLGISIHVFTPLLFAIFTTLLFLKAFKENRRFLRPILAGIITPIVITIYFLVQWQNAKNKVNYILNESIVNETALPLWAKLSQHIPKNIFMEKMLKTDLVYSTPGKNDFWRWRMPQQSFVEIQKHDPLVMMSVLFLGKPDLGEKEKIKILESMFDSRYQAQERLWSGDMLETSNVISNIEVFPEYRIAYTEKILSVQNNDNKNSWGNEQEAIYTFHIPEGGAVTSLSLWMNGKEEKAVLTTKSRADSAYKTIVGVEQRDPSVVQWKEGNTVSVRVFPCTPKENRRFKIGITSPLRREGKHLVYENINFEGPSSKNATETVKMQFTQKPVGLFVPFKFPETSNNVFNSEKQYEPYWEIKFNAPNLSNEEYSFDGCNYRVQDYKKSYGNFIPEKLYLDLNSSWSKDELLKLWREIKDKEVYVYENELIKVNEGNLEKLYDRLSKLNFSLFPLYKIQDKERTLIISKSTDASPNLNDLNESKFSKKSIHYLKVSKGLKLFNLGYKLSPYLKSLKELRMFSYDQGSIEDLIKLLKQGKYIQPQENDSTVVIDNSQLIITKNNGMKSNNAPDHLLRLFYYNDIMKKVSGNYFTPDFINDETIAEAQKAYVVSPVSSLIVLETQKDYKRFGIKDINISLKNASIKSSGAVPEPHEWMLIILSAFVVLYMSSKSYFEQKTIV